VGCNEYIKEDQIRCIYQLREALLKDLFMASDRTVRPVHIEQYDIILLRMVKKSNRRVLAMYKSTENKKKGQNKVVLSTPSCFHYSDHTGNTGLIVEFYNTTSSSHITIL